MSDLVKQIPLTQNQFALVDAEDYEYLMQWKWYALFKPNGNCFYAVRNSETLNGRRKMIKMHRLIMNNPKINVDHIDHNTLNNCRSNLRVATHSQNMANRNSKKNGTSQYLGVGWHKVVNKWYAGISKDNKSIHIGVFKNEIDAALAYNKKAIEIHGEFANLNLIPA